MTDEEVRELLDGLTEQDMLILHELLLDLRQSREPAEHPLSEAISKDQ